MRILVTGSSGLVGRALCRRLTAAGHELLRLVRARAPGGDTAFWDPLGGAIETAPLKGIEAAVHLAGENLAARRWSAEQRERIRESRVRGTRLLAATLADLHPRPRVLVSASAVGYYGDRGDEVLTEADSPGEGFLAALCRAWEEAAAPAAAAGIRVVPLRLGVVLAREGGALPRMLPFFRWGLGGPLGSGRHWLSWVTLADAVTAILFALTREELAGPVNVTSPHPVRSRDFARALGRVLRRPAFLPAPAPFLRLLYGPMAREALLTSQRALPRRLLEAGFTFAWPELEPALRALLRPASACPV